MTFDPLVDYDNRPKNATRKGNWMQTFGGRQYWPNDPRPDDIFIDDIAHALANACRYAGHCDSFYSVAEHSWHCSYLVPPEHALTALMHDATEAYVVDVPRPIKGMLLGYKELEHLNWRAICAKFGLPLDLPLCVKEADNAMLLAEARAIMKWPPPEDWKIPGTPAPVELHLWNPNDAEIAFLERFRELSS